MSIEPHRAAVVALASCLAGSIVGWVSAEPAAGTTSVDRSARAPLGIAARAAGGAAATGASPSTQAPDGARIDESRLQRRTAPVQCKGVDTVRLDGVLLQAERVAIQALGKCGVQITNSRVVGRVAVQATGNTTVTIENSIIEGRVAIQAAQASAVTVRSSTVQGRVVKLQRGMVRDSGQNVWR